jgi:phosphate/sulfate permease
MTGIDVLIVLTFICGFYVAWNIGANDVANAMGTSVGSGALTLRRAVILAAIFEFSGAYFVGSNVSETVRKKMFDPQQIVEMYGEDAVMILACGMIASLTAAGTWLLIATFMSWPVSTTHSIVGAVVGFGCVALGFEGVQWDKVMMISAGWVISPLISGAIAYLTFGLILKTVFYKRDPVRAAKAVTPRLVFLVVAVLSGVTTYKGLKGFWKNQGIDQFDPTFVVTVVLVTAVIGFIAMMVSKHLLKDYGSETIDDAEGSNPLLDAEISRSLHKAEMHLRRVQASADDEIKVKAEALLSELDAVSQVNRDRLTTNTDSNQLRQVEKIFVLLQVITACLVAFAHGSNDVANAIGPLSAAYQALNEGVISAKATTPSWALILGGVGIVIGLATWGWRVIQTVGKKITELTPSRGFCAEFAAAITILAASTLPIGLPISTTHTLVGAVLGVGLARGINALNLKTMRDIVAGWAVTIPAGAGLSVVIFLILKAIFVDGSGA